MNALLLLLMASTALTPPAPPPPAAPVFEDSLAQGFSSSASTAAYSTSGLTVGSDRAFASIGFSNSPTLTSFQGADDTSTDRGNNSGGQPKIYLREMTIVSSLDATWTVTLSGSSRPGVVGFVVSGAVGNPDVQTKAGSGPDLPSHDAMVVTGGPRNVLVVDSMVVLGAHITPGTAPPAAPGGHTLAGIANTSATNQASTSFSTTAVAYRTYEVDDLTWTGDEATIPAATWGGLSSIATFGWRTLRAVFVS